MTKNRLGSAKKAKANEKYYFKVVSSQNKAVKEAEINKEEDKKKKWLVDARNAADSWVAQAEKMIADNADKIDEADKKLVEEKIADVKKVLENTSSTCQKHPAAKVAFSIY